MTDRGIRTALVVTFLATLFVEIICVTLPATTGWIEYSESTTLTVKLLSIYSVPLCIILGGVFAERGGKARRGNELARRLALAVTAVWNLLFLWRCFFFYMNEADSVTDLTQYLGTVAGASTFLVAGALAYFFVKKE